MLFYYLFIVGMFESNQNKFMDEYRSDYAMLHVSRLPHYPLFVCLSTPEIFQNYITLEKPMYENTRFYLIFCTFISTFFNLVTGFSH